MRHAAPLLAILAIAIVAVRASAQTPDVPTPTQALDTPTAMITATATATPLSARPDEIVFTGELLLPVGTAVRALFGGLYSSRLNTCATAATGASNDESSLFVLRVPVSCAEGVIGPSICWSETGCYAHLADHRECTPWDGCPWSDSVRPGAVVSLGFIPIAQADEVIFVGEVPAPAGTTITVRMLHIGTGIIDCDTATTTSVDDDGVSSFLLRAPLDCIQQGLPPLFCWGEEVCGWHVEQTIVASSVAGGVTIGTGLLRIREPVPPRLTHGDGGPGVLLPPAGGGQEPVGGSWPSWLLGAASALLVLGLAALVALGVALPLIGLPARHKG